MYYYGLLLKERFSVCIEGSCCFALKQSSVASMAASRHISLSPMEKGLWD